MGQTSKLQNKDKQAKWFILIVSLVGWSTIGGLAFQIDRPDNIAVFLLLVLFMGITEYYPIAIWKGYTSLSFPLLYTMYIVDGLPLAVTAYALIMVIVNIVQRRPLRIILFNPSQLTLSLIAAVFVADWFQSTFNLLETGSFLFIIFVTLLYYFFNNLFVDLVLLIRPQPYTFTIWKTKVMTEVVSALISITYIGIMFYMGSQNRGVIDVFTYFFFFSPLVGFALLSSIIVRLHMERNRIKALFAISTELNRRIPTKDWVQSIEENLNDIVDVDASILWVKEEGKWKARFHYGQVDPNKKLTPDSVAAFEKIEDVVSFQNGRRSDVPVPKSFHKALKAFIFAPIILEGKSLGMFVVARSRTHSFREDDVQSVATLANQLAIAIKTRMLISEQEKRTVLEERNRIAREIHDGVAQSLAGAVLKLETANRKFHQKPQESQNIIMDSLDKLRFSLKEIRESIYALRPYETERVGLKQAIVKRIEVIQKETELELTFEERGKPIALSPMVEKVMFDIFQESVQNTIKHAGASQIHVLLSYQKEHVLLKITDNGVGFSLLGAMVKAKKDPHFGILSMNEQAEKIEASLQINSEENEGTEIVLTIPKLGFEGGMEHDQRHASG
ncbi:GAF domain-containing sensor histidine kinase [Halobacillus yeomjeoni]|uniref:GAF domain-containing sensor histidine kinase n=1 Tax=Halobacillus yeomjeoni TaxID=311194 RepID=UPI001CD4E192|nr:GAF domain-containing sensor histidine kinase [Halobacillus yeomjeoni]MCA0984846.1 GAF domain-containing sensor histidine kinase [Halobacillus yeomjeoni]